MITKKDYEKLTKNDRIEYLLRKQILDNEYEGSASIHFMYNIFIIIGFIFIIMAIFMAADKTEQVKTLTKALDISLKACTIVFLLLWLLDIFRAYCYSKHKRELEEDFFNFETKPKKK